MATKKTSDQESTPKRTRNTKATSQVIPIDDNGVVKNDKVSLARKKSEMAIAAIDHTKSDSVNNFGIETQKKLNQQSDAILSKVRAKDSGEVGLIINDLLKTINYIDVDKATKPDNIIVATLKSIPGLSSLFDKAANVLSKYDSVAGNIDAITQKLDESRLSLMKDSTALDVMRQTNFEYIKEVFEHVQVGEAKIKEVRENYILPLTAELESGTLNELEEAEKLQELNQYTKFVEQMDKKVHNLRLTATVAKQTLPQIDMIQQNNEIMVEKIQNSILTTIPLWKGQVTIALALNKQSEVVKMQKNLSDTTNNILNKNADLLKQNSIEAAKENERGVVDLVTLQNTNKKLIESAQEVMRIKEQGARDRENAVRELEKIENELSNTIIEMSKIAHIGAGETKTLLGK